MTFIDVDAESCEILGSTKKYRLRIVWDLPVNSKTFKEIGEALFYVSNTASKMDLEFADSEGMVFLIEVLSGDLEDMLKALMHDFEHRFSRVQVFLEESE